MALHRSTLKVLKQNSNRYAKEASDIKGTIDEYLEDSEFIPRKSFKSRKLGIVDQSILDDSPI